MNRDAIVAEALSWKGTPFIQHGRLRGIGADCFTFVAEVMIACGLFPRDQLPPYQQDWFVHAKEEHIVGLLNKHAAEIMSCAGLPTLQVDPGNIVVTRIHSRIFNHAAIVIAWPRCLHCLKDGGVQGFDVHLHPMWAGREVKIFDPLWRDNAR